MPLSNGISATPYNGLVIRIPHPTSMKPGMLPSLQIPSSPGPGILGASPGTITSMPNTFMNVPRYRMPLRDFSHITCFKVTLLCFHALFFKRTSYFQSYNPVFLVRTERPLCESMRSIVVFKHAYFKTRSMKIIA